MVGGVTLFGLQPEELGALWPVFWGLLSKANEADPASQISEDATLAAMRAGKIVGLYALEDGRMVMALTLEINETPRGKVCEITAIGGAGMVDWLKGVDSISAWAESIGCKYLQASGRSAWERVLRDKGFRKVAITVEKALAGET